MLPDKLHRRDFLSSMLAGLPLVALDWDSFPVGGSDERRQDSYDVIVIGAGLGGLSCAAAFARQGFRVLVLEQHRIPGGYATTFRRPGGFVFDVSLHSTSVGERNGIHNLIPGFPEIEDVEFVPHEVLYRLILPEHDIRVPHRDVQAYIKILSELFPTEQAGIKNMIEDMRGLNGDIQRFYSAGGRINMNTFPVDFPYLFRNFNRTWGAMMDDRLVDPKLKSIFSALWGYFGLPPSKLSAFYYAMPTIGYLDDGGYYPVGRSQKISDAFREFIEGRGGEVMLNTRVEAITIEDGRATGVRIADGRVFKARAIVSNANAWDTFHTLMDENELPDAYRQTMDGFTTSISTFQIWLGLNRNLPAETGLTDTEVFFAQDYDIESQYRAVMAADVEHSGFGLTLYDNIYDGYSPDGKCTINILNLQGYDFWEEFESDYFQGNKTIYRKEKERIARRLIEMAEETVLPGLSDAIEVMEVATPLTNVRYTSNYRGAIYGWDQTVDNSGNRRFGQRTPIGNLYLSGAWTGPGGGYGAVIPSGLMCFAAVMEDW